MSVTPASFASRDRMEAVPFNRASASGQLRANTSFWSGLTLTICCGIGDETHQAFGVGKDIIPEADDAALGTGIDLVDIGLAAQGLDQNDLEQRLHLFRQRPESVDQFGGEAVDLPGVG